MSPPRRTRGAPGRSAALACLLAWCTGPAAQGAPQPPCGHPPQPAYAQAGEEPALQVWKSDGSAPWIPPPCTGWTGSSSKLLVALAGTFRSAGTADDLLQRFGAISAMRGIWYWSVTDKTWHVLVTDAGALGSAAPSRYRSDFSAAELKTGLYLYFWQNDSGSSGEVVYRMRVRDAASDRLVLELENVTPVRAYFLTIFRPEALKFLYYLERRGAGNWSIYMLLSADSSYAEGNVASFVNRAAAFYRHFTSVATDGAPPLSR